MNAIVPASIQVAAARQNLDRANAELAKATEHRDRVASNIQGFLNEKAEIAAKRKAGSGDDYADASRLQLIALDLEGLHDLHAQANLDVTAAQGNVQQVIHQASLAEQGARHAEDEEMLAKLVPHVRNLAEIFGATLAELKAVNARLGRRDSWKPSPALIAEIRRLEHHPSAQP
jgi:hypothetical protein